jgi:cell division protein FtsQ
MNAKQTIRKLFIISLWVIIGGGMLIVLAAAIRRQKNNHCRDYMITIKGEPGKLFADEKNITELLMTATSGKIKGQLISAFNLRELEEKLEENSWIDKVDLYFDNMDVLHVTVTEKIPLARIFTTAGNSFYIDKNMNRIPVSDKRSARVAVFTGFPAKKIFTANDSVLLAHVRNTAAFIAADSFWMSQVAQIDITPERNFEMVPVVGNHLVRFGNGEKINEKFNRLWIFYKEVLSKSGFDKYKTIDVQYAGQVIGIKGNTGPKLDSTQHRMNVEKLIKQAKQTQQELNSSDEIKNESANQEKQTKQNATDEHVTIDNANSLELPDPNPRLSDLQPPVPDGNGGVQAEKTTKPKTKKTSTRKPKALMPKKTEEYKGYN